MMEFQYALYVVFAARTLITSAQEPMCKPSEIQLVERLVYVERDLNSTTEKLDNFVKTISTSKTLAGTGPNPHMVPPLTVADLEMNGWTVIFRATSGNGDSVYDAWVSGTGATSQKPVSMERSKHSHYRDEGVGTCSNFNIKYLKFAFYEGRHEVAYVIFNAKDSNITNWFHHSNVIASSWTDLTSSGTYNVFSIVAYPHRRFHINKEYGGCPGDIGYLVVSDIQGGCQWDKHPVYPQFLYSKINSADQWERLMFGRAVYLAIFAYL